MVFISIDPHALKDGMRRTHGSACNEEKALPFSANECRDRAIEVAVDDTLADGDFEIGKKCGNSKMDIFCTMPIVG